MFMHRIKLQTILSFGPDAQELRARSRKGFNSFFDKANLAGRMPRIIACGGRQTPYDKECSRGSDALFRTDRKSEGFRDQTTDGDHRKRG